MWYGSVPVCREEKICNFDLSMFGSNCNVSNYTIKLRHDRRTLGLNATHFLPQNAAAENRAAKTVMSQRGTGFTCDNVLDFVEPENVRDVTMAVLNLQSIDSVLWPFDYTANVLLRVAAKFGYWSQYNLDVKTQVNIYKTLFKEVMRKNAESYRKPPMMFDAMVKEAENVMELFRCPVVKPVLLSQMKLQMQNSQRGDRDKPRPAFPLRSDQRDGKQRDGMQRDRARWDYNATMKGLRLCIPFNKENKCSRVLSSKPGGDVCKDAANNQEFIHLCCVRLRDNAVCGRILPAARHQ